MSEAAIRAGKAFVEIGLRDKVSAGLATLEQRFMSWGQRLAAVGGAISAASAGMLAPLLGAAKVFADAGSEVFDMSKATGVGAEALTALKYAAEQSGASMDDVGAAMKGMGKFALALTEGNKEAADTMADLGLSAQEFLAGSPEERLALIADALQGIEDPGIRTAQAMKLLGKAGTSLLPMLADGAAGLAAMTTQAREFNLTMTDEEAGKADALGDAWGLVSEVFNRIVTKVGAALADTLTEIFTTVARLGSTVIQFVSDNQAFIATLAKALAIGVAVGTGIAAVGVGFIAAGAAIAGAVTGFGALATVAGAVASAVAFIASPVGIVTVALAGIAAAAVMGVRHFLLFTESGRATVAALGTIFGNLYQTVSSTLQGIWDSLMAGNWKLAGAVAMAGLNVALAQGLLDLKTAWRDFQSWLYGLFAAITENIGRQFGQFITGLAVSIGAMGNLAGITVPGVELGKAAGSAITAAGAGAGAALRGAAGATAAQEFPEALNRAMEAHAALAAVLAEATAAREKKNAALTETLAKAVKKGSLDSPTSPAGMTASAAGTFSAFQAAQLGAARDELLVENTNEMKRSLEAIDRNTRNGLLAED